MTPRRVNVVPGMKWCPRCERRRDVETFGFDRTRDDGLTGWCRECRARNARERRAREPERHRAETRGRYQRDPVPWKAKVAVGRALASGRLVKPDRCEECDRDRPLEAHHREGYAREKWLTVVWLCRPCHALEHAVARSA